MNVKENLEKEGFLIESAELTMIPENNVEITDEEMATKVLKLYEALEENEDVQNIYANFEISDVEMRREGPSYTVDTIQYFKKLYGPTVEFYFIAGTDTIRALPTWKFIDELIDEVHFIGATRPDGSSAIDSTLDELGSKAREKQYFANISKSSPCQSMAGKVKPL